MRLHFLSSALYTYTVESIAAFRNLIYDYYKKHRRPMPWRETGDPYRIVVSEIMLQQTQVDRVLGRYEEFITAFPDIVSLAEASLEEVLRVWQGLGYNRRALSLKRLAEEVVRNHGGVLPRTVESLTALPGIGNYTASAFAAFAFNEPVVFIETNIRTVFIHFFFPEQEKVNDREIARLVDESLDRKDPRNWYYALMDYGTMLKKSGVKGHRMSAHYKKQTPFKGSDRQVRGAILKLLIKNKTVSAPSMTELLGESEDKIRRNLVDLVQDGLVRESTTGYTIGT